MREKSGGREIRKKKNLKKSFFFNYFRSQSVLKKNKMSGPGPDRKFSLLGPDRKNTSFFFKGPDRTGRSGPVPGRFPGFRSKTPTPRK